MFVFVFLSLFVFVIVFVFVFVFEFVLVFVLVTRQMWQTRVKRGLETTSNASQENLLDLSFFHQQPPHRLITFVKSCKKENVPYFIICSVRFKFPSIFVQNNL